VIRVGLAVSAALFLGAAQSAAQAINSVPRGSLFGSGPSSASRSNLDVMASVSQARDSEPPPELRSAIPQGGPQSAGYSSMFVATADYERKRFRFDLNGSAVTALRYFQRLDRVSMVGSNAALGGTFRLARQAKLELTQDAAYSPSYLFRLFPTVAPLEVGDSAPTAPDYRVDETRSYAFDTRLRFDVGSPRGNRIELSAERRTTDFQGVVERPDLEIVTGGAKWSYGVGRTGSLSGEYEFRKGEFGYGGRGTEQRLRVGGVFTPALSQTRRATVRFNVAPSAIEIPESALYVGATGTLFKFEADGAVEYPFLRSWSVGGSYRRGVEYIAVLQEPVFRDAVRLALAGLVGPRIDVSASAGSSVGESVFSRDTQRFDTYTGTARARYGVTRSFALYGEYLYYFYNFHGQTTLSDDLPNRFEQHGVRAGVMLWARPVGR
jgi:hypothetical protein